MPRNGPSLRTPLCGRFVLSRPLGCPASESPLSGACSALIGGLWLMTVPGESPFRSLLGCIPAGMIQAGIPESCLIQAGIRHPAGFLLA